MMKPSRIMLMMVLVILPLFVFGSVTTRADDQVDLRAPGGGFSGAGSQEVLTPGDILDSCDVSAVDPDSDYGIYGVEFDGYQYYVTGHNGWYAPNDTNKVYIWERNGGSCQFICAVNQPTYVQDWGWADMAFDGTYLYACDFAVGAPATECTVQAFTADCNGVTLHPSADIVLTKASFPGLYMTLALAYDPANDWFWTSYWGADIYAFDRSGNLMQTIASPGYDIYGLAWDDVSPGGPFLWAHTDDGGKSPGVVVRQVDPNETPGNEWTGVNYSGYGDVNPNVPGGLCLNSEGCLSLVGISQCGEWDSLYVMEISTDIVYDNLDTLWVPWAKIGRFANDRPVMGFRIDCVETPEYLESVTIESFITKAFSVDTVRLYKENNGIQGLQVPGDLMVGQRNTYNLKFDSEDTLKFSSLHHSLSAGTNKFYIALCAHSDSIGAHTAEYDSQYLEVLIRPGRIVLNGGGTNPDSIYNRPYGGPNDDSTGFCANDPNNPGYPDCRYRLMFDTRAPEFDIHYAVMQSCAPETIDQEDTVRIYATGVAADMCSILVDLPFFGFPNFVLKGDTPIPWEDTLIIPDTNWTMPPAIDIDTGHTVEAMGIDTAGNIGFDTLYFNEPIDTYKPIIDSVKFFIAYDANGDGTAALGDSLGVIVFCESNPKFEVSRGVFADLSNYFPTHPTMQVLELIDYTNNNWIFRGAMYLDPDSSEGIDYAADSALNVAYITAYDNACNYQMDTAALGAPIDLEKPILADLFYDYHWDEEVTHWCIGIGDSVRMGANLSASPDVESVWVDMFDAGIDSGLLWAWYPLFDDGNMAIHNDPTASDLFYNLKWKVGNPPLAQGKDADNTVPPPIDADYSVLIKAMDDAGNWDTLRSEQLNRTLDTRRPRPINPDSLIIQPIAGAKIQIKWGRNSDEADAWWFYIDSTTDLTHWGEVGNFWDGWSGPQNNIWESEALVDGQYYCFRITTKDNCDNLGPYTVEICALADGTPPNACIVYPDSGLTFGAPFEVKARSEDEDIESACLWYRLWPHFPDSAGRGSWMECISAPCMYRPDEGLVFFDTIECIHDYIGWVELLPKSCDQIGNCQTIDQALADACLDDEEGNLVPGHFFFYWDTTVCVTRVKSVNDTIWPQSFCGYNVTRDMMNTVVIDVVDAGSDLFTIDVRALVNDISHRIEYANDVTMPYSFDLSVENWPAGTQNLYVYVTNQTNGQDCVPQPLVVELCVPEVEGPCITIVKPLEWQRVPCSRTDMTCVPIWAVHSPDCDTLVSQVQFWWAPAPGGPWTFIDEVLDMEGGYWKTCWNNKEWIDADILHDGDEVYFMAIGWDVDHVPDTSEMVKVFLDCSTPAVRLLVEDLFYSCGNHDIPKINCDPLTFKAYLDTSMHDTVDIVDVDFWYKDHSDPDMFAYWHKIGDAEPAHDDSMGWGWLYLWESPCCSPRTTTCLNPNTYYDFRVTARDQAGNRTFDYDEDGKFDDSTFSFAVSLGSGITVFVDNEAPQPAFSMVADPDAPIYNVNPSTWLGGTGEAYVKAHDDVTAEISVLPSEDSCEVKKVEYFLGLPVCWDTIYTCTDSTKDSTWVVFGTGHWEFWWTCTDSHPVALDTFWCPGQPDYGRIPDTLWHHVSTGYDPYHFPITFNPWELPEFIPHYLFEDGWWSGPLKAVLYDSLDNYKTDMIELYVLDVDPSQALIVQPLNDSYVWGDVALKVMALNAYEICKVVYEYKIMGKPGDQWQPIPNGESESPPYFVVDWHTPDVEDGYVCLRARAMDCSNNWDDDPPTICVWVDNSQPTVVLDDPRVCERTCPDDTVDTLGYVGGTVPLYATATSGIAPVTKVEFYYKSIFAYPTTYTLIGTDYFPTDGKYSVRWPTSSLSDGRYHLIARVCNAAGRYNDSNPITISVDNTEPYTQVISIDGNHFPDGMYISGSDVISIEVWAMDSSSSEGWTRCYNTGVYSIEVCMENCKSGEEITKCFELDPAGDPPYDGFHTVDWNVSGLEFTGCEGCYYVYVKATDCLGNVSTSDYITIYVSDITAPITTIGGFDGNYIYGYSSERVSSLAFQYADSGSTNWIHIGWSNTVTICSFQESPSCNSCPYYLYKTSWDPTILADGVYQVRVISHDTCSNQDDDQAPWAFIHVANGIITPYNPDVLGALSFEKNWCVGGMHGIVRETSSEGTPVVIGRYNATYECVGMQSDLQDDEAFAGSFFASAIDQGGPAKFFSSVTVSTGEEHMTGEPAAVTYLRQGSFDVVQVKRDVGTHGTYQQGCVEVTIPEGAVGGTFTYDRYIWVAPTMMPWAPVTQPDLNPIGDNNGYATYVEFTDCYYCCGWWASHFGGDQGDMLKSGGSEPSVDTCCFNPGRWAKIKMCYDSLITTDKEHLAVMWWDCQSGEFKFDNIFYPAAVEGFNTTDHTVEFATTCLGGPFAVVELLERECEGSIVVSAREQDIEPYCNGYTNNMPTFTALITDNVQGTAAIDTTSIQFKIDLFSPGELIRIYTGAPSNVCDRWMTGFGSFLGAGYDPVSGIFRAGWNDPDYYNYYYYGSYDCEGCYNHYCTPMHPLDGGSHMAVVTAMNSNIQTCTDTVHFTVDATEPEMWFAESVGAWVGANPHICMYFTDLEAGVDKNSIWIDIYGDETTQPDPNSHSPIGTLRPDQLHWADDTTVCVDFTFDYDLCGYLHIFVYGGPDDCRCGGECAYPDFYDYKCGIADCVGNHTDVFWQYFSVDAEGPDIAFVGASLCDRPLKFEITDHSCYYSGAPGSGSGIHHVYVYEDSTQVDSIWQDPHNPDFWWYTPSEGVEHVDIKAVDNLGNQTVYSFENTADCVPPVVTWMPSWVNCTDPTVTFQVTDDVSGVDWSTVNVDLYSSSDRIQTFTPSDITHDEDGYVTVTGDGDWLGLGDNYGLNVVVYSQKNYGASYTRGPMDSAGNYQTNSFYYKNTYYADCYGPTITWKSGADSCTRPLSFEIKDARSGIATITITEDETGVLDFSYNDTTKMLSYSPSAGGLNVVITATDNVGNITTYSFISKEDCTPPVVTFLHDYVSCTPIVSVVVTDAGVGVDWSTVSVDLYRYSNYVQTFTPEDVDTMRSDDTITVTGDMDWLRLTNGSELYVVVYSEKTTGTSYQKGPKDISGNYQTSVSYFRENYYVDCVGPSISWENDDYPCERPLKFKITDGVSGVAEVRVFEDSSEVTEGAITPDPHNEDMWEYLPNDGQHDVDVRATDNMGNVTVYSFKSTDDCEGPAVNFVGGYVTKNPVIQFVVTDDGAGVDWSTVNAYVSGCGEECMYLAPKPKMHMQNDTVTLNDCHFDCSHGQEVEVYIYSGSNWYGKGPADLFGNYSPSYYKCSYVVDALAPVCDVNSLSDRPIVIHITDDIPNDITDVRSGIDWSTLEFYEDSLLICEGLICEDTTVKIDTTKGTIEYMPPAGRLYVDIYIKDKAGNLATSCSFYTEEEKLSFNNPHNYPNPFDPRDRRTTIVLGLSKSAYVTAKIYDFAGEYVTTLQTDQYIGTATKLYWDATTEDGIEVGNGTYLCHIKARDDNGAMKTAVIKITVKKEDK